MDDDQIYILATHEGFLLVDLNSLEHKFFSREEFVDTIGKKHPSELLSVNNSFLDRFSPKESDAYISPTIVTSFRCNYACDYCYQKNMKNEVGCTTPDDILAIAKFYEQICETKFVNIPFGLVNIIGGEPLLPENKAMLEAIAKMFPTQLLSITTNGTYINDYSDFLSKHLVRVRVSVDGTKEMHLQHRLTTQTDAYEQALSGIAWLQDNQIETVIISVFNPENIVHYPVFFDKMEKLGWLNASGTFSMGFIPKMGCGYDDISIDDIMRNLEAYAKLKKMDSRASQVNARGLMPGCISFVEALADAKDQRFNPYRCSCLSNSNFSFLPDGTVRLCLGIPGDKGCIGRYKPTIEIDREKLKLFGQRRIDTVAKCRQCNMKVFCRGGCVATAIEKTGRISGLSCGLWDEPLFLRHLETVL